MFAWEDDRAGETFRIYAARVTPGGTVLDPGSIPITPPPPYLFRDPGVASSGDSSLIASGFLDVTSARLAHDGTVLDPDGIYLSEELNAQSDPSLAFGAGEYLAVWQDARAAGAYDIIGTRVTPDGVVVDPTGLLISGSGPTPPPAPAPPPPVPPPPPPPPPIEPPPPQPLRRRRPPPPPPPVPPPPPQPPPPPPAPPPPPPPPPSTPPPPPPRHPPPPAATTATCPGRALRRTQSDRLPAETGASPNPPCSLLSRPVRSTRSRQVGRVISQTPRAGALRARGSWCGHRPPLARFRFERCKGCVVPRARSLASGRVVLRRVLIFVLLAAVFAPSATAARKLLTPGLTYERKLEFTPHGPVVIHVLTVPRPGGLWR